MPVVQVQNLVKRFGAVTAVNEVSFAIDAGEIFGILGPNGAGKTTLLEIVEGLQQPTAGGTTVLGHHTQADASAVKERIGVQLQASAYFDFLNLTEVLDLFGSFYRRRIPSRDLLAQMDLLGKANTKVGQLSGGQRQRFTIAASLVNDPEVVILDEPTTGLDPQARHNVWDLIREIHGQGRTVVLTTHYMEEAEELCDRVAIMDHGRVVALDTPQALVRRMESPYRIRVTTSAPLELAGLEGLLASESGENAYEARTTDAVGMVRMVVERAAQQGARLDNLEVVPATLEDVFLNLTGHALRD